MAIVERFEDVIPSWGAFTRVSPVWAVAGKRSSARADLSADQELILLGPVQPALLETEVAAVTGGDVDLWLTLGTLNVLARTLGADRAALDGVQAFAEAKELCHQRWRIESGRLTRVAESSPSHASNVEALKGLAAIAGPATKPSIGPAIQEFAAIAASTLARAATVSASMHNDLGQTVSSFVRLVRSHQRGEIETLDLYARLVTMNAALSRFSSQAFSGLPPVEVTECHFWIHSLLGTGAANIAISRLAGWVQSILGEARLDARLGALVGLRDRVPTRDSLTSPVDCLGLDLVDDAPLDADASEPVIPLITYFSGRDGFSSHLQTLSAPLATLAECNSHRSSLMTITHEMSHVFIQGVLGTLYPDVTSEGDMNLARALLKPGAEPGSLLDAARLLLLEGVYGLEQANQDDELPVSALDRMLPRMLSTWRADAQETLVHTFDFLYFYQREPEHYIESIWYTWSAIPGIADRIPEYVMRTLCAISVAFLADPPLRRLPSAMKALRDVLSGMVGKPALMGGYVALALSYLDGVANDEQKFKAVRQEYSARLNFVRLVKFFLYSEKLVAKLFNDPYAPPANVKRGKPLSYETVPIGNPLSFLRDHLKTNPSEAESAWVLHTLAFSVPIPAEARGSHGSP